LARAGIVWARWAAGRIAAGSAAVALLASAVGFSALPTGAGVRILEPERTVLRANVTVLPDDPQDLGGQTRRILAQLTVTVTPQGTDCRR